jgi:hypothetical protein
MLFRAGDSFGRSEMSVSDIGTTLIDKGSISCCTLQCLEHRQIFLWLLPLVFSVPASSGALG